MGTPVLSNAAIRHLIYESRDMKVAALRFFFIACSRTSDPSFQLLIGAARRQGVIKTTFRINQERPFRPQILRDTCRLGNFLKGWNCITIHDTRFYSVLACTILTRCHGFNQREAPPPNETAVACRASFDSGVY